MSWPLLHYRQDDLAALTSWRAPLPVEYHVQNHVYGLDAMLREYANLPADPLPWAIEHFISFGNPEPYPPDAATRLPVVLAITDNQAMTLAAHVRARVEPIGAAYLYVRALLESRGRADLLTARERRGTLVLLERSGPGPHVELDRDAYAAQLAGLPAELHPVTVSISWRDFARGTHKPFLRAGLKVVTCGHENDPEYLFRQHDLLMNFRYACSTELSASFCVAILNGCRFFLLPPGPPPAAPGEIAPAWAADASLQLPGKQLCLAAARYPLRGDGSDQRALAEQFAGSSNEREPEFFRSLWEEARAELTRRPAASLAFPLEMPRDVLGAWTAVGLDDDGWAADSVSLEAQPPGDARALALELELPVRDTPTWTACWRVSAGGGTWYTFVAPGTRRLVIPLAGAAVSAVRAGTRTAEVRIDAGDAVQLEGESRRRTFRVKSLAWLSAVPPDALDWAWSRDGVRVTAPPILRTSQRVVLRYEEPRAVASKPSESSWLSRARHAAAALVTPKIGVLRQHPPLPLLTPPWYAAEPAAEGLPRIALVTPSYNQVAYLPRTLESVLAQKYPHLAYTVQDGASRDTTREVLARYASRMVQPESSHDTGQAQAINRGLKRLEGDVMGWLNSDDLLLPGALFAVGAYFRDHPDVDVVYGHRVLIDEEDREIGRWVMPPHESEVLRWADYVPQESLYWRRSLWERIGGQVDETFRFAISWDLLLRFAVAGARFARLPRFLGALRLQAVQEEDPERTAAIREEASRLRTRIHGRAVPEDEVARRVRGYLLRGRVWHELYSLGMVRF